MRDAFISDAVRTPIGRYSGALARARTDDLAAGPSFGSFGRTKYPVFCELNQGLADTLAELQVFREAQQGEDARAVRRRFPGDHEPRLHSVSPEPLQAEIQAAAGRGRRALSCIRLRGEIPLCTGTQIHAVRRPQRKV